MISHRTVLLLMLFVITSASALPGGSGSPFDRYRVRHYDIAVSFDIPSKTFSGHVVMSIEPVEPLSSCVYHASSRAMVIDSVLLADRPLRFRRQGDSLEVFFPAPRSPGIRTDLVTYYHGHSIFTGQYDDGGVYVPDTARYQRLATISEPFYARRWWPCKDLPSDKAPVTIAVTVPAGLKAVSNGLLKSADTREGKTTYRWETSYPVATYLVSVAVAPYTESRSEYHAENGRSMPVVIYAYPADSQKAAADFRETDSVLHFLSRTFCEYPFLDEKFGYAEVDGDLTMENQTLCSISASIINGTGTNRMTYIHETAHHWWGDLISPKTWHDTWLNEGFATYTEALYAEYKGGPEKYRRYVNLWASVPPGSYRSPVIAKSDTVFWDCFALSVYLKGALVLHMLRGVVGDQVFFDILRSYIRDPRLRYGSATTADFIGIAEKIYGKPLRWFFDEWLSAPPDSSDRPLYHFSWKDEPGRTGRRVAVSLRQKGAANHPYRMPVEIGMYTHGAAAYRTFIDSLANQEVRFDAPSAPDSVVFDPRGWIFKSVATDSGGAMR